MKDLTEGATCLAPEQVSGQTQTDFLMDLQAELDAAQDRYERGEVP